MNTFSTFALWATIAVSVSVMFVPAKWATTIPELAACGLAALWVATFLAGRRRARMSVVVIPMAGVILWGGFQILIGVTVYEWQTWIMILYWSGNFAAFFVGLQIFAERDLTRRFLRGLLTFGLLVSVISPLQALTTKGKVFWLFQTQYTSGYVFGPFVYTNQYAAFIELLLPLALYGSLTKGKWRSLDALSVAIMYASVIASGSRTGFILTTLEILIVPCIMIYRRVIPGKEAMRVAVVLAGMIVLLGVSAGPAFLINRLSQNNPYTMRREFVYSSLKMIRDRPLVGVGLGNWATAYPGYAVFDDGLFTNQAHNDWVQWGVEGGIPLFALMAWMAIWGARRGLRSGWGSGIAAIFIHCFFDYPIQRTAVAVVLFILMAAVACTGSPDESSGPQI